MGSPLFSIVTVTLNSADDAVRTAHSVLAQTFDDYEYIVKDGGSSDGTPDRLHALGRAQVHVSPDSGVYNAMNQALALCSGKYVCFMNAGDLLLAPETLATVAQVLQHTGYPAFAYGDVRSFVSHPSFQFDPALQSAGREIQYPNRLSRFYLYRKMICHQAWFVDHAIYMDVGGFDEGYRLLADYAFLLSILFETKASYTHIPAVTATYQGGGVSEKQVVQVAREKQAIRAKVFKPWERMAYDAFAAGLNPALRQFVYRQVLPRLPAATRKRLNGW